MTHSPPPELDPIELLDSLSNEIATWLKDSENAPLDLIAKAYKANMAEYALGEPLTSIAWARGMRQYMEAA